MSLMQIYMEKRDQELLDDPECRSGYEYARQRDRFWRGEEVELLQMINREYVRLYLIHENRSSLGIAAYLRQIVQSKLRDK